MMPSAEIALRVLQELEAETGGPVGAGVWKQAFHRRWLYTGLRAKQRAFSRAWYYLLDTEEVMVTP